MLLLIAIPVYPIISFLLPLPQNYFIRSSAPAPAGNLQKNLINHKKLSFILFFVMFFLKKPIKKPFSCSFLEFFVEIY